MNEILAPAPGPLIPMEANWDEVAIHLVVAFIAGWLVTLIYRGTRPKAHVNPSFPPTLVLLAILIAVVTQVIGNNVARAFSLVGALSIVRFRTVVRDTQDTAFVIFAVVVGMAAGAGNYGVAAIGLLVGGLAAAMMRAKTELSWSDSESVLSVRLNLGADPAVSLGPMFKKNLDQNEVLSVVTAKQGVSLDYTYRIRLKRDLQPAVFVKELNTIEGVQNVELRRAGEEF